MNRRPTPDPAPPALARRLRTLQVGIALQGSMLWLPVEKLLMSEIGFTAASIGVMAAAYAAVVPLLEVPSGILADRWSRSRLLVLSSAALAASVVIGGLSRDVATYVAAAMILGVYFAMSSGTVDSIVYDTVLEETGSSDLYEAQVGRVRMVEAGGLVVSALAGGVLADWTSPRTTYVATIPFALASIVCFVRFREPRLHRASEPLALRRHVALTFRMMLQGQHVRRVVLLAASAALLSQAVFEFGPLWLVTMDAPAAAFGPYWAALVASLGVGGYLAGRLHLDDRRVATVFAAVLLATPVALVVGGSLVLVMLAQTLLAVMVAVVAIHAGALVHDAVASTVRAGVSSGVGTLGWLLFLPFSLVAGWVGTAYGQPSAGWLFVAAAVLLAPLLIVSTVAPRPEPAPTAPADGACREVVELLTDYLDDMLPPARRLAVAEHLAGCDGCTRYLHQIRAVIDATGALTVADLPDLPGAGPGAPGREDPD